MLRVHFLQKTEQPQTYALFLVEVGNVVNELEVFADSNFLVIVHFAHHEASNIGRSVHKSDCAGAGGEGEMSAVLLNTKRFAHGSLNHVGCSVSGGGTFEEPLGETVYIPVGFQGQAEVGRGLHLEKGGVHLVNFFVLAVLNCYVRLEGATILRVLVSSQTVAHSIVPNISDVPFTLLLLD